MQAIIANNKKKFFYLLISMSKCPDFLASIAVFDFKYITDIKLENNVFTKDFIFI